MKQVFSIVLRRCRLYVLAVLLASVAVQAGCASKQSKVQAEPASRPEDLVVLLPDSDGSVGRAAVKNAHGTTELDAAHTATRISDAKAPSAAVLMSDAEVQQVFGEALGALPPAPQRFTVYFRFESEELTVESHAHIPAILQAVKDHPVPEVVVIGHTDTTGRDGRNLELGLRRARTICALLIASGVDASAIEVSSHGEADLLVRTADEVFEPRNRRVEITVR